MTLGQTRSEDDQRQPAIALCVFEAKTSRKVEYYAQAIARHFFTELSASWDGKLQRKLQQEVEENLRSIAKHVPNQTSSSLPEGINVVRTVQVDLKIGL